MTDVYNKYIFFRSKSFAEKFFKNLLCVLNKNEVLGSLKWLVSNLLPLVAYKKTG